MPSLLNAAEPVVADPRIIANRLSSQTATSDHGETDHTTTVVENEIENLTETSSNEASAAESKAKHESTSKNLNDQADQITPRSNSKPKVTPSGDTESKKTSQKKVNQMSLSSFFLPKGTSSSGTTSSQSPNKTKNTAKKREANEISDLEQLKFPCKRNRFLTSREDDDVTHGNTTFVECSEKSSISKTEEHAKTSEPGPKNQNSVRGTKAINVEETDVEKSSEGLVNCSTGHQQAPGEHVFAASTQSNDDKSIPKCKRTKKRKHPKPNSNGAKKPCDAPKTLSSEEDLSVERRALHQKHQTIKKSYIERANQLVTQAKSGIEEENFKRPQLESSLGDHSFDSDEFPAGVVSNMALLIEGSDLSLSSLSSYVCNQLKEVHEKEFSLDSVNAKIKVLAQRKAYFDLPNKTIKAIDLFEDSDESRLWRWELTTLEILPSDTLTDARKARLARKKIGSYHSAVLRLIKSLDDAEAMIFDPSLPSMDKIVAKVSRDEEKVLKFEREAEKQRVEHEARARKLEKDEAKKRAREEAAEKKRQQKEEAANAREDAKRKKDEMKERLEKTRLLEEKKKQQLLKKQKRSFISFFGTAKNAHAKSEKMAVEVAFRDSKDFDGDSFRAKINSCSQKMSLDFKNLSSSALSSRKRRTKHVAVMVYTTVVPEESEWEGPAYAEQKIILVPNKYRFLSFHEDCRPAYHGTWSKKSKIVTGKSPFGKEPVFDYEYDSEAEWEDGDDEVGEDIDDDAKNAEEDLDEGTALYDYDDGFCVADEKMLDSEENADEETKAMYKRKLQCDEVDQKMISNRVRIIAPGPCGVPLHLSTKGLDVCWQKEIHGILTAYEGATLCDVIVCLDAFPKLYSEEENKQCSPSTMTDTNKDEYTQTEMIAMAKLVHHSTLNSKEKVVEELRITHPNFFSVRAKAIRKLDSIASKQKHPVVTGVYYWKVKKEILKELGLGDLLAKPLEGFDQEFNALPDNCTTTQTSSSQKKRRKCLDGAKTCSTMQRTKPKNSDIPVVYSAAETPTKSLSISTASTKSIRSGTKKKNGNSDAAASLGMRNLMTNFLRKK